MSPTPNLLFKPAALVSDSPLCQCQSEQCQSEQCQSEQCQSEQCQSEQGRSEQGRYKNALVPLCLERV
jgi:hypothetical protein